MAVPQGEHGEDMSAVHIQEGTEWTPIPPYTEYGKPTRLCQVFHDLNDGMFHGSRKPDLARRSCSSSRGEKEAFPVDLRLHSGMQPRTRGDRYDDLIVACRMKSESWSSPQLTKSTE